MAFSPDRQFLAYDLPAGETTLQRDMYVLAVDGSREIPAEVHPADDTLLGWAPDGSRLLFASDRSGGTDLWARRFSEGKMQGSPEMLKRDIGRFDSMGITSSGSLHYSVSSFKPSDVMTAEFDFGKGDYASAPVQAVSTYVGTNESPEWSRDGKYLAWISRRKSHGAFHFVIGFRSLENGQVRELLLPPNFYLLAGAPFCWSHDGTSFLIGGQDKGRSGIFRVDRESGHTSLLVDVQSLPAVAVESADGQNLYYWSGWSDSGEVALFKRVLATAVDTVLLKGKYGPFLSVSADGRYLAVHETPRPRTPEAIILVPTDGSTPRELIRTTGPDRTGFLAWLPDRESVLIAKVTEGGKTERWRIPFDGGEPKRLDMKNQLPGFFKLHPDGRQVAFPVPGPAKPPEVWVLENFLPATAANR